MLPRVRSSEIHRKSWRTFLEAVLAYCLCRTAAGIDMLYQHSSAALSETPLGALIFPRAPFGRCWLSQLCDNDEQQEFPSAPGRSIEGGIAVSCSGFLEAFPLQGMRCFTWKMGFRCWGSEEWSGEGWCGVGTSQDFPTACFSLLPPAFSTELSVLQPKVLAQCPMPVNI